MLLTIPVELTVGGVPFQGATPTWYQFVSIDTGNPVTPQPPITNRAPGLFGFQWDAEMKGECDGWIDWGPNVAADGGRYRYVVATRESGRILSTHFDGVFVVG